jgi:hypothetical protein
VDRADPPASANLLTGARLVRNIVEPPAGAVVDGQRVAARIELGDGREIWADALAGRHEIELAPADGGPVWMQALRTARVGEREVHCDSTPVLLRDGDTHG